MSNGNQAKAVSDLAYIVQGLVKDLNNDRKNGEDFKKEMRESMKDLADNVEALQQTVAKNQGQMMMLPIIISTSISAFWNVLGGLKK